MCAPAAVPLLREARILRMDSELPPAVMKESADVNWRVVRPYPGGGEGDKSMKTINSMHSASHKISVLLQLAGKYLSIGVSQDSCEEKAEHAAETIHSEDRGCGAPGSRSAP